MIHYTCDCCKKTLESDDLRYVVKMEVYAAIDPAAETISTTIETICPRFRKSCNAPTTSSIRKSAATFTTNCGSISCPECRKKFVKNPLGRAVAKQFDFSKN